MKLLEEFKAFAFKGNVMDLAVGVIIGAAFGKIVSSLVEDVITPLLLNPALKAAGAENIAKHERCAQPAAQRRSQESGRAGQTGTAHPGRTADANPRYPEGKTNSLNEKTKRTFAPYVRE